MPYRYSKREGGSQYFYVENNGYEHKSLFRTSQDCQYFADKLAAYAAAVSDDVKVMAYFLSFDSFHIVFKESKQGSLAKMLHKLSVSYAMYFNNKYKENGKLFQGPYKDRQLHTADEAIVKSIQVHKMALLHDISPTTYKWSSLVHVTSGKSINWIDMDTYLEFFRVDIPELPTAMQDFMDVVPSRSKLA